MQTTHWQKSSYSGDGSNCIYVAAPTPNTVYLRESDEPDVTLSTTEASLRFLIQALKPPTQQPSDG